MERSLKKSAYGIKMTNGLLMLLLRIFRLYTRQFCVINLFFKLELTFQEAIYPAEANEQ